MPSRDSEGGKTAAWRARTLLTRASRFFAREQSGTTAIEFALVAGPFFLLVLGIMVVALQYFTTQALDDAVSSAARKLRTGEAQKAGLTLGDFRQLVCDAGAPQVPCDNRLIVHIKSGHVFADLNPPISCVTDGALTPPSGEATDLVSTQSGAASAVVLVTACYNWDAGGSLWTTMLNLMDPETSKSVTVLSATKAFRTEPYQ